MDFSVVHLSANLCVHFLIEARPKNMPYLFNIELPETKQVPSKKH